MDGDSLRYTLLRNITEGGKETKETKINSVSTETDSTADENSEKETTEESEKELVDTTAAKKTAKRRKKLKPRKRDISEEEFVRGDVVRWTLSTHRDKKEIIEKEVAKREHKRLSEVGRHRSEALMKSRNMQWKKNVDVRSEQQHQASKLKSTRVSMASEHRQPKTMKVENGGQGVAESENENSESDQSDSTATRQRDEVLTKSRRNMKNYYTSSRYNSKRKSRKKLVTSRGDWTTLRIKERQSLSFMEELNMNPMTPLPDSDSPQVFINHGQVTCHSRWPSTLQH